MAEAITATTRKKGRAGRTPASFAGKPYPSKFVSCTYLRGVLSGLKAPSCLFHGLSGARIACCVRFAPRSACQAENVDDLGNPLFQASGFGKEVSQYVFKALPQQRGEHVGEGGFFLVRVPWPIRELQMAMAFLMKPGDDQAVKHQRHRSRAADGFLLAVGRVFETEQLLAVFKGNFYQPATVDSP